MAPQGNNDESIRRRRAREDEIEKENSEIQVRKTIKTDLTIADQALTGDTKALDQLIKEVETQLERLHGLYLQFFSGVENAPPNETRKRLEQLISKLERAPKPAPSYRFKVGGLLSKCVTYRERWERSLKDLESGKINRPAGPKKNRKATAL